MSILIKGMEMPISCNTCELAALVDISDGLAYGCRALKEMIPNDRERLPNCPLIPVPPHGRLIDADALYSHIKDEQRKCNDPYEGWSECQVALGFVNTAPTIIEAEEG